MTGYLVMLRSRLAHAYLFGVALIWVLGEWVGERTLLTLLLAYAPPVLWLLPAPLVWLWVLLRRRRIGAVLLATGLAAWGAGFLHWRPQSGGELRVLTFNVLQGKRTTPTQLLTLLRQADADIILLQEADFLRPGYQAELEAGLPGYNLSRASEVTTLTRLPVLGEQRFDLPLNKREVLASRLNWRGQQLTVVNAHLGTVMLSPVLRGDLARVRRTRDARNEQVQVLKNIAMRENGPILLGGDLNTPPRGLVYRRLRAFYGPDAYDLAGRGPGWTFPSLKVRIDHLLTRDLKPTRAQVLPSIGSDHLPLLVEFKTN